MLTDRTAIRPILRPCMPFRVIPILLCLFALVFAFPATLRAQQPTAPAAPAQRQMPRVFLDCDRCDDDYIRKEVTFVDYVRNREDSDVHVLVTLQDTGGGGRQWTLKFIGLGQHKGADQTLIYNSAQTATDDEVRAGFVETFKRGLLRYALDTAIGERLQVTLKKADEDEKPAPGKDPWDFWVFEIEGNGNFNGEEQQNGRSISASFDANRTTDAWRTSIDVGANYQDTKFLLDDDDDDEEGTVGGRRTVLSVRRDLEASGIVVKSLSQHWSLGLMGSAESQTFRNFIVNTRVAPGIEYNFFPYSESTRRMLTFQYTVGHVYHRYREETLFRKFRDQLVDHRAEIGLSLRQPWGTANAELNFEQYLTDPSKYNLGFDGGAEIRLFRGFSVNFFGEFSRTRDQIYLPAGRATNEEILLRQRQLLTGYQYFFAFGFDYTFGSIFNNIVNPRFGGGG
jgi:hypothetical protein